jgi:glycosyltransferase involved in cell wall biosynthesis
MKNFQSLKSVKIQHYASPPKLSLGIRVKNEIEAISYFWDSVKKQTYFNSLEIVFIDSGSTDGTIEFLNQLNCNLYTIAPEEFSFGETCNLVMQLTTCKHVCFFSGHVILENDQLLEKVAAILDIDPAISGYFRQTPNYKLGCTIYDSTFLKYKFPIYKNTDPVLVTPETNSFSNAASFVYRKHWEIVKFKDVIASEDYFWAMDVMQNNMKIYYFHSLNVHHSHQETFESIYKRVRINATSRYPEGVNFIQLNAIFLRVFAAIFLNTGNLIDSLKYAKAHSSAYKNLVKNNG